MNNLILWYKYFKHLFVRARLVVVIIKIKLIIFILDHKGCFARILSTKASTLDLTMLQNTN
jgi:hypothetical protein